MGRAVDEANTFRAGHPLAQRMIATAAAVSLPCAHLTLHYTGSGKRISIVESLVGKAGWLRCERLAVNSIEPEDHVVCSAVLDDGTVLDVGQCIRLLELPGEAGGDAIVSEATGSILDKARADSEQPILEALAIRNGGWFDVEMEKLDRWAEDRRQTLKAELSDVDDRLKELKKAARVAPSLPEKLERQRDVKRLEVRRDEAWRGYDRASQEVDRRKEDMLDEVSRRMLTYVERNELVTVNFSVI
jgi:hypothetical protein